MFALDCTEGSPRDESVSDNLIESAYLFIADTECSHFYIMCIMYVVSASMLISSPILISSFVILLPVVLIVSSPCLCLNNTEPCLALSCILQDSPQLTLRFQASPRSVWRCSSLIPPSLVFSSLGSPRLVFSQHHLALSCVF